MAVFDDGYAAPITIPKSLSHVLKTLCIQRSVLVLPEKDHVDPVEQGGAGYPKLPTC